MVWDTATESKFKLLISKIPIFHRQIAESVVRCQAEDIAVTRNAFSVHEQDVLAAFFSD